MADRGEDPVVVLGAHLAQHGATGLPQLTHHGRRRPVVFGQQGDDHLRCR